MAQMARGVAQTLNAAFNNVPMPIGGSPSRKEKDILKLREAIEQMVLALSTTVKDGGFEGINWPRSQVVKILFYLIKRLL